ncbi:MAG: tRNA (N6-threonylcarbamoyladenosine(37)-N6)-methyltransferase TrmO [Deltaproteobacteria bacterium]|jgi:tRNA-Thr(GGU) m(6)t(6)A37 methyltransferase TsaA|nr:tRNA (N6-threonylcarbamoyladenosine(37)-N6)-methyltransferase TrmO [Deltaproteobacteria bacterium]MBQ6669071.1 tRNA (N6-threonylcarbamoyladenosine(37)-N6)-methyltransferase TrmO [Deltaproteobacteria bacterium]MBR5346237.1 tRNA (N6-threonylcarbamoyladenosine(37)-N6)-methyltransferase TrmO [Deltaproteobacteria bacterium]MBR5705428.1 tRNA (N6-threonylcarbamoyladenosine(37)-N6)-methyltransferase TrmO [Deltaproteobacteria bacterium]MCR5220005.1 tRNA (N6-threonylcarbamoyladenosine(37)-N6)-methyltr
MARRGWDIPDYDPGPKGFFANQGDGNFGADKIIIKPIGFVNSPFQDSRHVPIQPIGMNDTEGSIDILSEYAEGLEGLEEFSYIYVVYHLHRRPQRVSLRIKPFMAPKEVGIFATRSMERPNPLGVSVLQLVAIEGNTLKVRGMDILDGSAVVDIRAYSPNFDRVPD